MALNFNSLISESSLNNQSSIRERDKDDTNDTIDDVDIVIKELSINDCDQCYKSGSETWKCVFSDDEEYFAWSSGFQIVQLLPKASYLDKNASNTGLTIDCGDLVRSLLFLRIRDAQALSENFWPKSSKCSKLFLVTGHHGKIRIWDTKEGKLLLQLNDHKSVVADLATNPDNNNLLISSSHDGTVKIRDLLKEGELIKTLTFDCTQVDCVQVSPNGKVLSTAGSSGIIFIWDMHRNYELITGQKIAQYNHLNPEPSLIFASGDNGFFVRSVCFSPDNHHLITVCDDNCELSKARVWDLENSHHPIRSFKIMNAISCRYSPSGAYFAIGTKNGTVLIMKTPKSVKSLLSLCRTEISKNSLYKDPMDNQRELPSCLVTYLNYE